MRKTILSTFEEWESVSKLISSEFEKSDLDEKFRISVELAMDEVFANILMHAYPEGAGMVEISFEIFPDRAEIIFKDRGTAFNPLEADKPQSLGERASERKIGGLGIYIIKNQVDEMKYQYLNNTNILTLVKYIKGEK